MSTEAAIALSLCVPPAFIIVRRLSLTLLTLLIFGIRKGRTWLGRLRRNATTSTSQAVPLQVIGAGPQSTTLQQTLHAVGDEDNPLKALQGLYTGLRDVRETEDSISKELRMVFTKDIRSVLKRFANHPSLTMSVILITILIVGLTASILYLGVSVVDIDADNMGDRIGRRPTFLDDPHPVWWFSNDPIEKAMLRDRAGLAIEQAETCYTDKLINHKSDCTLLFPYKQVPLDAQWYYTTCPFNGEVCEGADHPTLMRTGLVDSQILGVNASPENRFAFERNMTCSPVSNDDRFQKYTGEAWVLEYEDDSQRHYYAPQYPGSSGFDYRNQQQQLHSFPLVAGSPSKASDRYESW